MKERVCPKTKSEQESEYILLFCISGISDSLNMLIQFFFRSNSSEL